MTVFALIIGVLMILVGLAVSLVQLRAHGEAAQGSNRYSTAMALIGAGCAVAMVALIAGW